MREIKKTWQNHGGVKEVTVRVRMDCEETAMLDRLCAEANINKSEFLRRSVRKAYGEMENTFSLDVKVEKPYFNDFMLKFLKTV